MKPIFRSAMFGFHKEDVFNFITKQNKQYEEKIATLNAELERRDEELRKEREAFHRDTDELAALKNSIEQSHVLLTSIGSFASKIQDDKVGILNCVESIRLEQSEKDAQICEMSRKVAEAETLREKAEKFDRLSGVLSSIFNHNESESEVVCSSEPVSLVEECASASKAVEDLLSAIDLLAAHCDKLQGMIASELPDA